MRHRQQRGAALITVLAVVVLATILVVGLTVAMRMDRQASYYHLERERATLMAREGVETARALLRAATATNSLSWISQPGRIVTATQSFDLSSGGGSTGATGLLAAANLNRLTWQGNDRILDPQGGDLSLQWIYVRRDGSRETNQNPGAQPNNPVIGRYAYWVDDESTRVNLNTAWERQGNPNTNTLAAPSIVSLVALGLTPAQALEVYASATNRAFNTPFEALNLSGLTNILSTNRFLITHYTQDSDLNPWGEPKMVLTTQKNQANGNTNFLDILNVDNTDPGFGANVSATKTVQILSKLVGYLSQTNWPYAPGSSFATKYYPSNTNRVWQLAADILDYVRSAESSNVFLMPTRGDPTGAGGFTYGNFSGTNSIIGTVRHPMITEVGVRVGDRITNSTRYELKYTFEMYLPTNFGVDSYALNGRDVPLLVTGNGGLTNRILPGQAIPAVLLPGQFAKITQDFAPGVLPGPAGARPTNVGMRLAPTAQTGGNVEIAPLNSAGAFFINCPVDSDPSVSIDNISSAEVNDPRVNKNQANWIPRSGNSFGAANAIWMQQLASQPFPPQDMDGGAVSAASLRMPYPKGHANNPSGLISSPVELGYISTGIEAANANGVPWRSVRLQPTANAPTNVVPDWALLDLFSAPISTNGISASLQKLYTPHENTVAGRINLNAGSFQPFTNLARTDALNALFTNVTGAPADIVSYVEQRELASAGQTFGATNLIDSVGELAEIRGISDGGESSEQTILRQVVRQATVRGNVFSIYSIGQALKETPSGTFVINGEKMLQTMIERYTDGAAPKYRVVYWREINP